MNKRIYDAVIGLIVGDAFGVPYEFKPRYTFTVNPEMTGYGTYNQPKGTWSDDSSMTLATIAAFYDGDENLYASDVADYFLKWLYDAYFTPFQETFDVGGRTKLALNYYAENGSFLFDNDIMSNGNGSLMRILPVAFAKNYSDALIDEISSITHPHEISLSCCRIYAHLIRYILENPGCTKVDLIARLNCDNFKENNIINVERVLFGTIDDILSDGYVVNSLEAALWSFFNRGSYQASIITAVSLGYDTDTIAAITGGIAGLYYGYDNIPKQWINNIANLDYVKYIIKTATKI